MMTISSDRSEDRDVVFINVGLKRDSMTLVFLGESGEEVKKGEDKFQKVQPGQVVCWRFLMMPTDSCNVEEISNPWRRLSPMIWFESFAQGISMGDDPVDQDKKVLENFEKVQYWGPLDKLTQATFRSGDPIEESGAHEDDELGPSVVERISEEYDTYPERLVQFQGPAPVVWGQVTGKLRGAFRYRAVFQSGLSEDACEEFRPGSIPKTLLTTKVGVLFVPDREGCRNRPRIPLPVEDPPPAFMIDNIGREPKNKPIVVKVGAHATRNPSTRFQRFNSVEKTLGLVSVSYPPGSDHPPDQGLFPDGVIVSVVKDPLTGRVTHYSLDTVRRHQSVRWDFMEAIETRIGGQANPGELLPAAWMPSVDFLGMMVESIDTKKPSELWPNEDLWKDGFEVTTWTDPKDLSKQERHIPRDLINRHFGPFEAITYDEASVVGWGQSGIGGVAEIAYDVNLRGHHYRVSMVSTIDGSIKELSSPDPDPWNTGGG